MRENEKKGSIATTLEYEGGKDMAPRITAKGKGAVAEKIIQLAKQHNIPIKKDPGLVQILSQLDIDDKIPPELYKAVAEILAFVYALNEQYRAGSNDRKSESTTGPAH
jgi:flagellar biosynthesis protein